jgi:hypothetical protein
MCLFRRSLLAGCALVLWGSCAVAGDTAATPSRDAPAQTQSQQHARELLLGMARFLGGTPKFEVKLRAGYEVVQADGQKIEFGERRDISVERPGKFLSLEHDSDGRDDMVLFDGENIIVSDAGAGVFAKTAQPGDVDASVMYFVRDLQMRLPVAPFFMSRIAEELERRVVEVDYVEQTDLLGATAHHLAGRTSTLVDFQIWIRDGEQPVPLRLILCYRTEEGSPDFWADFSDWNLKPRFGRNTFRFEPPKDSRQIAFAKQLTSESSQAVDMPPARNVEKTP